VQVNISIASAAIAQASLLAISSDDAFRVFISFVCFGLLWFSGLRSLRTEIVLLLRVGQ
jgi:hypothetical protein